MTDVVYTAKIRIERDRGPVRYAYLPAEPEPIVFSMHSAIAEYYGVPADAFESHATTIDYVIAAAAA